jgi:PPPDE putative peptidase domain
MPPSLNPATFFLAVLSRSERIYVGQTMATRQQVRDHFKVLQQEYLGPSYNVLDRNCNHFTAHFVQWLTGRPLPDYVNRIMEVAKKVRVCLPSTYKKDLRDTEAPPEYESHKRRIPQPLPEK